jgi:hypothetical protein
MGRIPVVANRARVAVSRPLPMPAPVKGWMPNLPLTGLPVDGAVLLDNWFCEADGIRPRGGSRLYASNLGGSVETIMSYVGEGSEKLFAAAGSAIYEITPGVVVGSPIITGFSSPRWQTVNMATSGGPSLLGFNGFDRPFRFNGTVFSAPPYTAASGDPAVDVTAMVAASTYASRLFIASVNKTVLLYTAPDTFQGEVSRLEVGAAFARGGSVQALDRWTHDTGSGTDDYLVVVSTEGDIVVYSGTNPSDAASWNLVGTYATAKPVGRRCMVRLGGDLAILTVDGVKKMSRIVTQDSGVNEKKDPFYNVNPAIRDSVIKAGEQPGWGLFTHRDKSMFIVNVPRVAGATVDQYVMNIGTQAWSRFTGLKALCWASFGGLLYYGEGNGRVLMAETAYGDEDRSTFSALISGFSNAGGGRIKQTKMLKAILMSNVSVSPLLGVCFDYQIALPGAGSASSDSSETARWDFARFDISRWASGRFGAAHQEWAGVEGIGYTFATAMTLTLDETTPSIATIKLVGFMLLLEPGNGMI